MTPESDSIDGRLLCQRVIAVTAVLVPLLAVLIFGGRYIDPEGIASLQKYLSDLPFLKKIFDIEGNCLVPRVAQMLDLIGQEVVGFVKAGHSR